MHRPAPARLGLLKAVNPQLELAKAPLRACHTTGHGFKRRGDVNVRCLGQQQGDRESIAEIARGNPLLLAQLARVRPASLRRTAGALMAAALEASGRFHQDDVRRILDTGAVIRTRRVFLRATPDASSSFFSSFRGSC